MKLQQSKQSHTDDPSFPDVFTDDLAHLSPLIGPWNWVSSTVARYLDISTGALTKVSQEQFSSGHRLSPVFKRSFPSYMFWQSRQPAKYRTALTLSCSSLDSTVAPMHSTSVSTSTSENMNANAIQSNSETSHELMNDTSTKSSVSSVHLQLINPPTLSVESDKRSEGDKVTSNSSSKNGLNVLSVEKPSKSNPTTTTVTVHTYYDASTNQTWKGLNISLRKFRAYLHYCNVLKNETSGHPSLYTSSLNRSFIGSDPVTERIETVKHVILSSSSKQASSSSHIETKENLPDLKSTATCTSNIANTKEVELAVSLRIETARLRDEWRSFWKSGRLITDRTELLAVYPSDEQQMKIEQKVDSNQGNTDESAENASATVTSSTRKRGGFADLLFLYTDRLMAILNDERESDSISETSVSDSTLESISRSPGENSSIDLVHWLKINYGKQETMDLEFDTFQTFDEKTKLAKLKHFLEWFRSQFPYFYDRCDVCGASIKEDSAATAAAVSSEAAIDETSVSATDSAIEKEKVDDDDGSGVDDSETNESEHQTFVGYIFPNASELIGRASRTELYQCHKCFAFTRFPRYNTAKHVLSHRRGRCGEYSMVLFRFLRALNHECRWVVDWADHVWAELLLVPKLASSAKAARWVHLDPCEAAVDENFIYQDWGKKQNFIIGFYLPPVRRMEKSLASMLTDSSLPSCLEDDSLPLIEDITSSYTREPWEDVCQRREESESHIQSSLQKATHELQRKLLECYNFTSLTRENAVC